MVVFEDGFLSLLCRNPTNPNYPTNPNFNPLQWRCIMNQKTLQPTPVVSFQNVTAYYKQDEPVLYNLSLDIEPATRYVLVGISGSGKSTSLSCISGIKKPSEGNIFFNGEPLQYRDKYLRMHWRRVPIIDQDATSLVECHTVVENITKAVIINQ